MDDHKTIEKLLKNFELNKGNFFNKIIARTLYLIDFIQINSEIFIGPLNKKIIKKGWYKHLPELKLKSNQAYVQTIIETRTLLPPIRHVHIELSHLIKQNKKWEYDSSKPKAQFYVSTETIGKEDILPINEIAKRKYDKETNQLIEY